MGFLQRLFGGKPSIDFAEMAKRGAQLIDVRSRQEYQGGHIKGSVNIPLDQLAGSLAKIKKDKPVITCCASGMRSGSAVNILKSNGFQEVYNGGSWFRLQSKIH
ncbi:MAG: rhodanese-like domain-containing protein [Fluviicola sp.]|nr:rhodanese-like domain-containing protein [Fluviicola sp.]